MDVRTRAKLDAVEAQVRVVRGFLELMAAPGADVTRMSRNMVKKKSENLDVYEARFSEYFEELFLQAEEEADRNELIEKLQEFNTLAMEARGSLHIVEQRLPDVRDVVPPAQQGAQAHNNPDNKRFAQLPKCSLKEFSGDKLQWAEFIDYFDAIVDNRQDIGDVQKLRYLKDCCKGEAAQLIRNLAMTAASYQIARDILKGRFEDKKAIIDGHLEKLFGLKRITVQTAASLRTLYAQVIEHTQSLKVLGEPIHHWDTILNYMVKTKLDDETRLEWELAAHKEGNPTLQYMLKWLASYSTVLESTRSASSKRSSNTHAMEQNNQSSGQCFMCQEAHYLPQCPKFLALDTDARRAKVRDLSLCYNCFSRLHTWNKCPKPGSCKACQLKHHPTLHRVKPQDSETLLADESSSEEAVPFSDVEDGASHDADQNQVFSTAVCAPVEGKKQVLLATALVKLETPLGVKTVRALIDQGSMGNLITERCVQIFGLATQKMDMNLTGVGGASAGKIRKFSNLVLKHTNGHLSLTAGVISKVTGALPHSKVDVPGIEHLRGSLADIHFDIPGRIDLLLGASALAEILLPEAPKLHDGLVLQNTRLGYIISGSASCTDTSIVSTTNVVAHVQVDTSTLDSTLKKFWQVESVGDRSSPWSLDEKACESHFENTHRRLDDGRYLVCLPFRHSDKPNSLGNSRRKAMKLYNQLERRLSRNTDHQTQHRECLNEYLELGHAEPVPENDKSKPDSQSFYLPHLGVVKTSSTTTKYRTVFNASSQSDSGHSLNDLLMVGPNRQNSVFEILVKFRRHRIAFSADIEKMYRQIRVHEDHRDYLRFFHRPESNSDIVEYRMTSVTFGVASSAHHAQRCLVQLANDERGRFPLTAEVIENDMYMDDCLSGSENVESALSLQQQLLSCLSSAGFHLRKWVSNEPAIVEAVPEADRETLSSYDLDMEGGQTKTLGTQWQPSSDTLSYQVRPVPDLQEEDYTKRLVLSDTARVFDPLGTLTPTMLKAKLVFKQLCQTGVDWDEAMPEDIRENWLRWRSDLVTLNEFRIDRCVVPKSGEIEYCELHGFSDASTHGYAACVYMRSVMTDGTVCVKLIVGKSKVAPMKPLSVPRLELCGAYLLAQLLSVVHKAIAIPDIECYAWTDSTVTLFWIRGDPNRWKTFVANRVSEIQDLVPPSRWRFCPTECNPADCASRGLLASQLMDFALWWNGPTFLLSPESEWPSLKVDIQCDERVAGESKQIGTLVAVDAAPQTFDDFPFSDLTKIIRITTWCRRWLSKRDKRPTGPLLVSEIRAAELVWIKRVQADAYDKEIDSLKRNQTLPRGHSLLPLSPFVDDHGVLRVGGRLKHSNLSQDAKHQILLPKKHVFTRLLIEQLHKRNLHAAPRLLLCTFRQRFWAPGILDAIRSVVHKCVTCVRNKAATMRQVMGDLPAARLWPTARAFIKCGVDYAGPLYIKDKAGRGGRRRKCWIAYFVCFVTKACHIEVVTELTSDSFLAAFRRFVGRRGVPTDIYSDNATTFHGADAEIRAFLTAPKTNDVFSKSLAQMNIQWHFSPAKASHFGGLWESGIKSMKSHLYKELGEALLTYEEMTTLLVQIEACLNSRPLTPMSTDPHDFEVLTPGHFIIGTALNAAPDTDLTDIKLNRLDRWQRVQAMFQKLWKRFSMEYLHYLQERKKWTKLEANIKLNDLVLLKEENLSPLDWCLGRVIELFPGRDGKIRVVKVKTAKNELIRPIVKLAPLLSADSEED